MNKIKHLSKKSFYTILFSVLIVLFGCLVYSSDMDKRNIKAEENIVKDSPIQLSDLEPSSNTNKQKESNNLSTTDQKKIEQDNIKTNVPANVNQNENTNIAEETVENPPDTQFLEEPEESQTPDPVQAKAIINEAKTKIQTGYELSGNGKLAESYAQFLEAKKLYLEADDLVSAENYNLAKANESYILEVDNLIQAFLDGKINPETNILLKKAVYYRDIADHYFNL